MRTIPTAAELVDIVAEALKKGDLAPGSFHALVASNALRIAQREIEQGARIDAGIVARLAPMLDRDGSAADLEQALVGEIAAGRITAETPGLADHLWTTVLEEMAVDQPKYATYRACIENAGQSSSNSS